MYSEYQGIIAIVGVLFSIFMIACMWRIFSKADEKGWAALVPIYNLYVLYKITWGKGILFLLTLVPGVNVVVGLITLWKLVKAFDGNVVTFILFLIFPVVIMPIMAFGSAEYVGID